MWKRRYISKEEGGGGGGGWWLANPHKKHTNKPVYLHNVLVQNSKVCKGEVGENSERFFMGWGLT